MKRESGHIAVVALYLDELLVASSSTELLLDTKRKLGTHFEMKGLVKPKMILRIKIFWDLQRKPLYISQDSYVTCTLDRFKMKDANESSTPMDWNLDLEQSSDACDMPYREAIRSQLYLLVDTRPDILYAVAGLAKYVASLKLLHWNCIKRIFCYLVETKEQGWSIHKRRN